MTVLDFMNILTNIKQRESVFNPYFEIHWAHDRWWSPEIRFANLMNYLCVAKNFNTILVGEAPGYLGCRRTGIPFTDEFTLNRASNIYKATFHKATNTQKQKEMSAKYIWDTFSKLKEPPFMWNIFPLHPYKSDNPLSNRKPNKKDFQLAQEVIDYFFDYFKFDKYYAIGRVAETKLKQMGFDPIYIRHPSYGGSTEFKSKMFSEFGVIPDLQKIYSSRF